MVEGGENLPLGAQARGEALGARRVGGEQLDRHALPELAIVALGEHDDAHAAAAELAHDPEAVDPLWETRRHRPSQSRKSAAKRSTAGRTRSAPG